MSKKVEDTLHYGVKILHDPMHNKGTAFTEGERDALGLTGLLPPRIHSMAEQERRALGNIRSKTSDLERYLFLVALQDRNETLFYRVLMNNMEEIMPLIYTPTVGKACQEFGHIYRRPRGLYISLRDRGRIGDLLDNWPHKEVRVIVVTDGERILGLGDLGANGMGIPIGKLSLYTACAGLAPQECLPVMLDVGTNNESLLNDELYNGLEMYRVRGADYDALIEEFITTVQEKFPGVITQLEDFGNSNAFRLLAHYRERSCLFDDDIQGTGAVGLAGLLSAMRITGSKLEHQRLLFLGAGQAAIGIGETVTAALITQGMSTEQARQHCWYFDTRGLLVNARKDVPLQKAPFAHDHEPIQNLQEAVDRLRPTGLIGASGQAGLFTDKILKSMAQYNERPIIFALSNPTANAECNAEQAYRFTEGRAIFASGSPFKPVEFNNRHFEPGQCNNAYIFPGVGLGVLASRSSRVTDEMFMAAAERLAAEVSGEDLALGRLYPRIERIHEISTLIAADVAQVAWDSGLAGRERPEDVLDDIRRQMYRPVYPHFA